MATKSVPITLIYEIAKNGSRIGEGLPALFQMAMGGLGGRLYGNLRFNKLLR